MLTIRRLDLLAALSLSLVSVATAAVTTVTVGAGGFVFTPNSITAQTGDIVNFKFTGAPGNHTVSQASFAAPCAQLAGGFDSGFVFVPPGFSGVPSEWNLTISDVSKPIWFYCKQTSPTPHCLSGMVGAINPPASGNTLAAFVSAAKALGTFPAQTPGTLTGVGAAASAAPAPPGSESSASSAASVPASGSASASGSAASSPASGTASASVSPATGGGAASASATTGGAASATGTSPSTASASASATPNAALKTGSSGVGLGVWTVSVMMLAGVFLA